MLSLRRLAMSASRARQSSSILFPSKHTLGRQSRPHIPSGLPKSQFLVQLRLNSTESESFEASAQYQDGEGFPNEAVFRRVQGGMGRREPRGHPTEPTKVIYVGNLKYEITDDEIKEKFSQYGNVVGVRIPRTSESGVARGFAYVEYAELSEAAHAIEACHQEPFGGRRMNCQYVHRTDFRIKANPESKTLFIGNMSFNTTDEDLAELFKGITGIIDVRVATDYRTGQPRGFVHADFSDVESAAKAKEKLSGVQLYGRRIRVDFSTPPEERKQIANEQLAQRQRQISFDQLMEKRAAGQDQTTDSQAYTQDSNVLNENGRGDMS